MSALLPQPPCAARPSHAQLWKPFDAIASSATNRTVAERPYCFTVRRSSTTRWPMCRSSYPAVSPRLTTVPNRRSSSATSRSRVYAVAGPLRARLGQSAWPAESSAASQAVESPWASAVRR